ncbi:hypothetical protein [Gordonia sihwensis]|uniref:hypothetical protein n=1 Tax=Gordonia sihwensis TaxID=173559 RepID=UPI003D978DD3
MAEQIDIEDVAVTRHDVETWLGGELPDEIWERVKAAIPQTSVPDAIQTLVGDGMGWYPPED